MPALDFGRLRCAAGARALDYGDQCWSRILSNWQTVKDQGLKGTGEAVLAPRVTGAAPANNPTEVEITDCMDTSGSKLVRAGFINGLPGFITLEADGELQTTALEIEDDKIAAIYVVRNPDKLKHLH